MLGISNCVEFKREEVASVGNLAENFGLLPSLRRISPKVSCLLSSCCISVAICVNLVELCNTLLLVSLACKHGIFIHELIEGHSFVAADQTT